MSDGVVVRKSSSAERDRDYGDYSQANIAEAREVDEFVSCLLIFRLCCFGLEE